jgi:uncharacterized phage protein gp47/JayE
MPITDTSMYRERAEIFAEMVANLLAAIPDAYTGDDGVAAILMQIQAGQLENLYLANQLLLEDMFIQTASYQALLYHGEQYGLSPEIGAQSTGTLTFEGAGGTYVPIASEVGYDPGGGLDVIYFQTTTDGTIPNPGTPTAPVAAVSATAGVLSGTYEYCVTFVTAAGETLPSAISNPVSPVSKQVNLTAVPLGGVGTTARNIYRDKNGDQNFRLVGTIANNTATIFTDNMSDATHDTAVQDPTVDLAHRVTVNGQSEDPGSDTNVSIGVITELTNSPTGLIDVINPTAFTGGTEPEDTEAFRSRLLAYVQNPHSGSPNDLEMWAEQVDGVESATAFPNTPAPGSVTVRITGPGGTVPPAQTVTDVQTALAAQDLANITIIVSTFTSVSTDVTVDVTTDPAYTLGDVTPAVQVAISSYINNLEVGATMYLSGIIDAVVGQPGVIDIVVTTPTTNQTTAATSKRVAGTITVT